MGWPNWIKDRKRQWLIGTGITFVSIVVTVLSLISKPSNTTTQTSNTNGNNNISVQVSKSKGNTFNINNIDTDVLAEKIAKRLPQQTPQDLLAKETEIRELNATIERLKKDSANELKQAALLALNENDINKAVGLMEKASLLREGQAAQDWIDVGNIAYYTDTQKALSAYKRASQLDPVNPEVRKRLGYIQSRLGKLEKALQAFEQVHKLAGKDKAIQAVASSNLGNIYQIRGELNKAEELYLKSLEIDKTLGRQQGMAISFCNLGNIYDIRGDLDKAEEFYLKSLDINKALGRQRGMASRSDNLGNLYYKRGELDKACSYWQQSLEPYTNIGKK